MYKKILLFQTKQVYIIKILLRFHFLTPHKNYE